MKHEKSEIEEGKGQFLVYQTEDGKLKLDVRFEDESVWLSQKLMAELFQKDVRTISEHIQNIYDEGELVPEATIRKFQTVQMEGKREVARMVDFYNLDMKYKPPYTITFEILNRVAAISEAIGRLTVLTDEARGSSPHPAKCRR